MTHWENPGFRGSKTRHNLLNGEIYETQTAQITSLGDVRQAVEPSNCQQASSIGL